MPMSCHEQEYFHNIIGIKNIFAENNRMFDIVDFLEPIDFQSWIDEERYPSGQLGGIINSYTTHFPDLENCDLIIVGATECRGDGSMHMHNDGANAIRKALYKLYGWHQDIRIADIGNIKKAATLADGYAALQTIVEAAVEANKILLIIGGSHDNTLAQYHAYKKMKMQINATCIDSLIDLSRENPIRSKNFLMEMLTSEPNYIAQYSHLGFQSYFVHPHMLETLDKLRFDFHRVGQVSENIEEMEPVIRNTHLLSFDIQAIKAADAPASNAVNGLTGVEACTITRFAGMSEELSSIGIYGYDPQDDVNELTAHQISQMIWYFMDGLSKRKIESTLNHRENFNEYHTAFAEIETLFLQSKKTQRWWMQMPDASFIPCSKLDYNMASNNSIPERWLRVQER